jgi:predicted short-subunit dehydrogenase-like oxidoreductase (DUF2520 family)
MPEQLETISWIGCGKVGRTLARAFRGAGYGIGRIACRSVSSAREAVRFVGAGEACDSVVDTAHSGLIHFLTANDDAISGIVQEIAAGNGAAEDLRGHTFFHTSGSLPSTVLEPLSVKGAEIGSIHPLQVFADPQKALQTLQGIYFAIEGSDRAMALAVQMVDRLKGSLLLIPTGRKALYHAASVFASNYLTVLVGLVLEVLEDIGETPEDAYQAFLPLMVSALENVEESGVANALTGPIARGDEKTVSTHLQALREVRPEVLQAYKMLGRAAVELALRAGKIRKVKAETLCRLLKED